MKDILKVMRFDFLTSKPLALRAFVLVSVICFLLSLFFSPLICSYITFAGVVFVIPLQSIADKNGFNKLYGILPVKRGNITRARFLFVFLAHFISELIESALAVISMNLRLYRVLPNQESEAMQFIRDGFDDTALIFLAIIGVFTFFCLMFSYMEMMGQIFGRENEMKIILISLGVLSVLILGFAFLFNLGLIPALNIPSLPEDILGRAIVAAVFNAVVLVICMLFGEITVRRLAKREL